VRSVRWTVGLILGVVMFGIGLYVAIRPLWAHNAVISGARWLDMALAAVFMLRGAFNVRSALRLRRELLAQG
jgi:uncharacterized membrane protein HdeD (DUF308 family)